MTQKPIKATLDSSDDSVKTQKPILIQLDDIPTPEVGDAGKVLGVDAEGKYALIEGGGGGGIFVVEFSSDEEENLHCNKTYAEIAECVENNVPVFGVYINDNMPLQFIGSTSPTSLGFAFTTFEFDSDNNKFIVSQSMYQINNSNAVQVTYGDAQMSATIL